MEAPNVATRVLAVATFTYTSSENEYIKISNETDTELLVYVKEDPKAMLRTKKKSTVSASIRVETTKGTAKRRVRSRKSIRRV